jgi:spoIIIJ-associated protein
MVQESTKSIKITAKETKQATETIEQFLAKLGVQLETSVTVNEQALDVKLETQESGIIIGYHGETLEGLQLLLSLAVSKRVGRFLRVTIDVGDYRKQRTEYLEQLASQMKEAVLSEQRERTVSSLKSWERRIIHLILQDDDQVVTESQGTGRDRILVIKPK